MAELMDEGGIGKAAGLPVAGVVGAHGGGSEPDVATAGPVVVGVAGPGGGCAIGLVGPGDAQVADIGGGLGYFGEGDVGHVAPAGHGKSHERLLGRSEHIGTCGLVGGGVVGVAGPVGAGGTGPGEAVGEGHTCPYAGAPLGATKERVGGVGAGEWDRYRGGLGVAVLETGHGSSC